MHYTSSFSDFSLLQLRELLINGPDAKHHDNLQGTVFEDTENSQEQSAFTVFPPDKMDIGVCLQTYQSCSFGLYYCVYLLLCASLRLLLQKM